MLCRDNTDEMIYQLNLMPNFDTLLPVAVFLISVLTTPNQTWGANQRYAASAHLWALPQDAVGNSTPLDASCVRGPMIVREAVKP
jgi:hypothetical protein